MKILNEELISVIVPIYNVQQYLEKCILSIINQKYRHLEIILVDDGSEDLSGEICDRYALLDSRVKVIHKENGGLVSARKSGLESASGQYIGFVDGDDHIESGMFWNLYQIIMKTKADFVHSGFYIEQNGRRTAIKNFDEAVFSLSGQRLKFLEDYVFWTKNTSQKRIGCNIWSNLYRAELIKKAYGNVPNQQQYGEDVINFFACVLEADKLALTKNTDYYYLERSDSMSHTIEIFNIEKYMGLCAALGELFEKYHCYKDVETELKRIKNYYLSKYFDELNQLGYIKERYNYQDIEGIRQKRVVIYGAGAVGRSYYAQISRYSDCNIVAWIDANFDRYHYDYARVYPPRHIQNIEFDVTLIAVNSADVAEEIRGQLEQYGVSGEQIIWSEPINMFERSIR